MPRLRGCVAIGIAAAVAATCCAAALADGDPASDVLLVQDVFLPYDPPVSDSSAAQLKQVVAGAKRAKYRIKVALIGSTFDLGAVPTFMGKPKQYARFLGFELEFVYRGRLLVVMPNGFGVFHAGKSTRKEQQVLRRLRVGSGPDSLAAGAVAAIRKLAAAAGHRLRAPS
jgi:hypothetical protein